MRKINKTKKIILVPMMILSLMVFNFPLGILMAEEVVPEILIEIPEETIIETGDAESELSSVSEVNTNITDLAPTLSVEGEEIVPEEISTTTPETEETDVKLKIDNTNNANVSNSVSGNADTGNNEADNSKDSYIITGNAIVNANILNMANTNLTGSNGAFDIMNMFSNLSGDVTIAGLEDIFVKNDNCGIIFDCIKSADIKNNNDADIENNVNLEANTGNNNSNNNSGGGNIFTGNAKAKANIINIVNTNINGRNYLFLVINSFSNWLGDLVLPGKDFFSQFFSLFDNTENLRNRESRQEINVNNSNNAIAENNVEVGANTGGNSTDGNSGESTIITGNAKAETNISNMFNTNIYASNFFNLAVNVFGNWQGNVFSVPEQINSRNEDNSYTFTGENNPAENNASSTEEIGKTEYNIENNNDAKITNNVVVNANTGNNSANGNGKGGYIETGNAQAVANIFNMANTTIVGNNWMYAIVNIFGDWHGDIAFGRPDLWVGESVETSSTLGPGGRITYIMSFLNNGNADATGVIITDRYNGRYLNVSDDGGGVAEDSSGEIAWNIGTVPAGASGSVSYTVAISPEVPYGSTEVTNNVGITSVEDDANADDNFDTLTLNIIRHRESGSGGVNVPLTPDPILIITKTNEANGAIYASSTVKYNINIKNNGGIAYHAVLFDTLKDKNGGIVNEQSWDLNEIYPDEEILIDYEVFFNASTTPGIYINYAQIEAIGRNPTLDPFYGWFADSNVATSSVEVIVDVDARVEQSGGGSDISGGIINDMGGGGDEILTIIKTIKKIVPSNEIALLNYSDNNNDAEENADEKSGIVEEENNESGFMGINLIAGLAGLWDMFDDSYVFLVPLTILLVLILTNKKVKKYLFEK